MNNNQPPSYWDRIDGLKDELIGRIMALLQKHHLKRIEIPLQYNDAAYIMWKDDIGHAHNGRVYSVFIYELGICIYAKDNDSSCAIPYKSNEIGFYHIDRLAQVLDMVTDLLEGDQWRICSHCGKLMSEGYINKMGEPTEYYCSDECLHQHYSPQEWKQLCQGPEGQEDKGNDFCCWTTWY